MSKRKRNDEVAEEENIGVEELDAEAIRKLVDQAPEVALRT